MLCVFAAYRLAQGSVSGKEVAAFHHAYDVVAVEKHLGFFWELDIQSWFLQSPALVHLANAIYTYFYYPVLILFGIWAYNRHRKQYFTVRRVFLISAGTGFLCFEVPLSEVPSRLLRRAPAPSFHRGLSRMVDVAPLYALRFSPEGRLRNAFRILLRLRSVPALTYLAYVQ